MFKPLHLAAALLTTFLSLAASAQTNPAPAGPTPTPGPGPGRGPGRGPQQLTQLPVDAPGKDPYWGLWPSSDPKVVGMRLTLNLLARPPLRGGQVVDSGVHYADCGTVYGALRFAQEIKDTALADRIVARYTSLKTPQGKALIPPADHVDRSVFGIVPLEIYKYTKDKDYMALGINSADLQWAKPLNREPNAAEKTLMDAGLTWQTRYWIDDMFMVTALQLQAYRATSDKTYLDRAAKEMVAYLDRLQKPTGLFFHGEDAQFYWGRGDGWVAVGMAELLSDLPKDHPTYNRVMDGYKLMMAALLKNQGDDGMWHQLIDHPESYAETSSTGMFTFAFGVGVRRGWLPAAEYKPATKKAWTAFCTFLDDNANVREVCIGTGKGNNLNYYLTRPRSVGDPHGQAAAIWAAWAMIQQGPDTP